MKNMNTFKTVLVGLTLTMGLYSCSEEETLGTPEASETTIATAESAKYSKAEIDELVATYSEFPEIDYPSATSKSSSVTLVWDGDPTSFRRTLIAAVNEAGTNGTVYIPAGTYLTDRTILLPEVSGVTIVGAGRDRTILESTRVFPTSGLIISRGEGMKFINFTVDWKSSVGNFACAINTNGFENNQAFGMAFKNANIGFGTPNNRTGLPISGLKAINCVFENCIRGMLFNRNYSANQVSSMNRVLVISCEFKGDMRVGLSIDCGNDGADGAFIFRNLPLAEEAMGIVTDMGGTVIAGNTFEKATLFNIAVAKAKNLLIVGNKLLGTTGAERFTEAINIEHEASDIIVAGNKISNEGAATSYMSILTFRDYGNAPLFENGARNIGVFNNTFSGAVSTGITGEEAGEVNIIGNSFNEDLPTGFHVNFFTTATGMGNRNIVVQNNTNTPTEKIRIQAGAF